MEKIKELWENIGIQFVKFGLVGASNTVISLITYYIFVFLGLNYLVANFFGFVTGTLNAYYWNSRFVFKNKNDEGTKGIKIVFKTFVAYGATFVLSSALLFLMVQIIGISQMVAPIINLAITTPLNFIINKFWTFTKGKAKIEK